MSAVKHRQPGMPKDCEMCDKLASYWSKPQGDHWHGFCSKECRTKWLKEPETIIASGGVCEPE